MTQPSQQQKVWVCGRPVPHRRCFAIKAVHISTPRPRGGTLAYFDVPLHINQPSTKPMQLHAPVLHRGYEVYDTTTEYSDDEHAMINSYTGGSTEVVVERPQAEGTIEPLRNFWTGVQFFAAQANNIGIQNF